MSYNAGEFNQRIFALNQKYLFKNSGLFNHQSFKK